MSEAIQTENEEPIVEPVNSDWKSMIPEYGKDFAEVKDAKSFDDLFKHYDQLRSHSGQSIRLPGEDASDEDRSKVAAKLMAKMPDLVMKPRNDEERNALNRALGMPEDANGYKFEKEGFDGSGLEQLSAHALKAGLTQSQYESFIGDMIGDQSVLNEGQTTKRNESMAGLKAEWGAAYEEKTEGVQSFLKRMDAPAEVLEAEKNGLMDAGTYKWFDDLNKRIGVEGSPNTGHGRGDGKLTPAEIQMKIAEIRSNPDHAYNNQRASASDQKAAQKMMRDLYSQKPGAKSTDGIYATGN